jgi:hypothetical protein
VYVARLKDRYLAEVLLEEWVLCEVVALEVVVGALEETEVKDSSL